MASITWNGFTGNWSVAGNWSSGTVPGALDDVVIDASGSYDLKVNVAESAHSLTLSATSATLEVAANVTVSNGLTQTDGTIELDAGKTLAAGGAVSISNSGDSGVYGPGTLSTSGVTTPTNDGLSLDGSATWVNSGTVNDGLQIFVGFVTSAGTDTIINQSAGLFGITADETMFNLSGSAVADFINAGTLEKIGGAGVSDLNASVSSAGTVTSTSGTLALDVDGTLDGFVGGTGGGIVWLNNGAAFSTDGTATVVDAGSNDDLAVTNGATWTDSGIVNAAGRVVLGNSGGSGELFIAAGARFDLTTNDGSIIDGGGATLTNFGILAKTAGTGVSSVIGMSNGGTVDAAFGTLKLTGIAGGSGRLQIEAGDTLELFDGSAAGNNTVAFNGPGATLKIDTNSAVDQPILGLGAGSRIDLAAASSAGAVINGNTLTITPIGGSPLHFVSASGLAGLHATPGPDGSGGTVVTLSVPCFCEGVRIATACGMVAVEALRTGDHVPTLLDGRLRPIIWLGHRAVDCREYPDPTQVWPVRVSAGAVAPGCPDRDLYLSPDHAVFADGVLIPVCYLANGTTIVQEPRDSVTYWHVELAEHAVICAEGVAAESYLDTGNRSVLYDRPDHNRAIAVATVPH